MSSDIALLIELQKHDSGLAELAERMDEANKKIADKKADISDLKNSLTDAKKAVQELQVKRKSLETEVSTKEGLIKKHQGELNNLKSNDAYKAMLGEIDAAKADLTKFEDQILENMEATDAAEKALKVKEGEVKSQADAMQGEVKAAEAEKTKLHEMEKKNQADRDAYAKTVPADLVAHYNVIRERAEGIALAPLRGLSCGGCKMSLTQNIVNDVKKAKDMVLCETCSRILYSPSESESAQVVPPPAK